METKRCLRCRETKPVEDFYPRKDAPNGRRAHCIACSKIKSEGEAKARAMKNREAVKSPLAKVCPACNVHKTAPEFARNRTSNDGLQSVCRICLNDRKKGYREKNKAKVRAYMIEWRTKHLEHEYQYRQANRDAILERDRSWRVNSPEKAKAITRRRYDRMRVEQPAITAETVKNIVSRYTLCLQCGTDHLLEIDHIIPVAHGGTNEIHNLQMLCRHCNARKGTKHTDYRQSKWASCESSLFSEG